MEKTATKIIERTLVIRPTDSDKFAGHSSYPGTGQAFEGAQIGTNGTYKTGLTREEEDRFADELGFPIGTLSKNNGKFWGSMLNLRLPRDKSYRFEIKTLMDELKYRAFIANDKIAKSENEIQYGITQYYVEDKEAKAEIEEKAFNIKMDALLAIRNMTMADKRNYLSLYNKRGSEQMTDTFINAQLMKEAEDNPTKFLSLVNDPDVKVRMDIQKLLQNNIITKRSGTYFFENEAIGGTLDAVVTYFKDVKNQAIQMQATALGKKKEKAKKKDTTED